jgi:hypothetical protein
VDRVSDTVLLAAATQGTKPPIIKERAMTRMIVGGYRTLLAALLGIVALLGVAEMAGAQTVVINIPALSALPTGAATGDRNDGGQGNLTNAEGSFYFPVNFPLGVSVCRFTLYVRDFDDPGNATARLLRKGTNATSTFSLATQMASVSSTGFSQDMRAFDAPTISSAIVNSSAFYFVELVLPTGNNMEVLGFRIILKPTC